MRVLRVVAVPLHGQKKLWFDSLPNIVKSTPISNISKTLSTISGGERFAAGGARVLHPQGSDGYLAGATIAVAKQNKQKSGSSGVAAKELEI